MASELPGDDAELWMLRERMAQPQRHRLLHGFPSSKGLRPARPADDLDAHVQWRKDRRTIIGVLPHASCNPRVAGCSFCTFPHEASSPGRIEATVAGVEREIVARTSRWPRRPRVEALYLGGGTANLTPPTAFESLCRTLATALDLHGAEVTLEGVPAYFLGRRAALLDAIDGELPPGPRRISMGIQTFSGARLHDMGRDAFGDAATFAEVVERGHARGWTVSGDLLFDLPGQTRAEMLADLDAAVSLGLDHVCLYHLVAKPGLGTRWSEDPATVESLPTNADACENWIALRERLLASGFVQTTLTNFERVEVHASPNRFRYELAGFEPDAVDMFGFGPGAISYVPEAGEFRKGMKWVNAGESASYLECTDLYARAHDRAFVYDSQTSAALRLIRNLAALRGQSADDVSSPDGRACVAEGLWTPTGAPTARGCFYADAIAGHMTWLVAELNTHSMERHGNSADDVLASLRDRMG